MFILVDLCVCVLGAVASVKDEVVRDEKGAKGLLSLCRKVSESRGNVGSFKTISGRNHHEEYCEVQVRNDGCLGKGSAIADNVGKEKGRYLKRMCTSRIKRNW